MDKKWFNISELTDSEILTKLSTEYGITIPGSFSEFVRLYNGGKVFPCPYVYNPKQSRGVMVERILTFNEEDVSSDTVTNTILKLICMDKELFGIPFAISNKGVISISGNSILHRDNDTGETWVLDESLPHFVSTIV